MTTALSIAQAELTRLQTEFPYPPACADTFWQRGITPPEYWLTLPAGPIGYLRSKYFAQVEAAQKIGEARAAVAALGG